MATSAIDDLLDRSPIDSVFGLEEVAPLLRLILKLEGQCLGDDESRARINVTIDLIFHFTFLLEFCNLSKCFELASLMNSYSPSTVIIMTWSLGHSLDLLPCPLHLKHMMSLVLPVEAIEEAALGTECVLV